MIVLTLSFAVVQEMCTRLGAATGRGLLDLIREQFGVEWTLFAIAIIIIANGGVTISEFIGIGAASELLGISKFISVPLAAVSTLVFSDIWFIREGRKDISSDDSGLFCIPGCGDTG